MESRSGTLGTNGETWSLVRHVDNTQEEPGIMNGDANNEVPSHAWKETE